MGNYVTFELAKKLKEKGFDELCLLHYTNEQELVQNSTQSTIGNTIGVDDMLDSYNRFNNDYTDAPAISQVLKWLREEKKIFIEIALSPDGYQHIIYTGLYCMATSCAYHFTFDGFYRIEDNYRTYEQAVIAGIEYVIDNLI